MATYWIGCDPGTPLALAMVGDNQMIGHASFVQVLTDGRNDPTKIATIIRAWTNYMLAKGHTVKLVTEKVGIRPNENLVHAVPFVGSMFMTDTIAATLGLERHMVSPQRWKRAMKLSANKRQSLALARSEFPTKSEFFKKLKDHNVAEAALLALYASRTL